MVVSTSPGMPRALLFVDSSCFLLSTVCVPGFCIIIPPMILKKIQHSVDYEIAIFESQKMVKCWQFHMVRTNIIMLLSNIIAFNFK